MAAKKTRGRVAIDGAIARRHQVMLDEETVRRARALGDGNISLGLRRAVKDAVLEKYIRELRRGRPCAGRWYMLANDGMATLCASEADALAEAADADAAWPRKAPHRAVQLVPADQLAAAGEPVAWAHFAASGNIRLWAPERPRELNGNAAQPLYTADQLAAAVAAERERCIGIIESHQPCIATLATYGQIR